MKFQPDSIQAAAVVVGYDATSVTINATGNTMRFTANVIFGATMAPTLWAVNGLNDTAGLIHSITQATQAAQSNTEVVLIGTGEKPFFPSNELRRAWLNQGLAVEVMNTPAACRTYNILVSEGRLVLAALIVGQ